MAPLYRSMGLTPLMGDISSVDIPYDLDAVVSSNCLQWVSDMPSLLSGLYSALKPGGRLCFSTFGFRHFIQLRTLGMAALDYFTLEDMSEVLSDTGFTVEKAEQETDEMLFPSASDMLRYFSLTGVNAVRSPEECGLRPVWRISRPGTDGNFRLRAASCPLPYITCGFHVPNHGKPDSAGA